MDGNFNNGFQDPNAGFQDPNAGFQNNFNNNQGFAPGYQDPNAAFQNNMNAMNNPQGYAAPTYQDPNMGYNAMNQTPGYNTAGFYASNPAAYGSPVSKKSTGSLVCGIIGLCLSWLSIFVFTIWIPLTLGIIATALGGVSVKRDEKKGKAIAGLVMGAITILLSIIFVAAIGAALYEELF